MGARQATVAGAREDWPDILVRERNARDLARPGIHNNNEDHARGFRGDDRASMRDDGSRSRSERSPRPSAGLRPQSNWHPTVASTRPRCPPPLFARLLSGHPPRTEAEHRPLTKRRLEFQHVPYQRRHTLYAQGADGQDVPRRPGQHSVIDRGHEARRPGRQHAHAPEHPRETRAGRGCGDGHAHSLLHHRGRLNHVLGRLAGRLQKTRDVLGRLGTQANSDDFAGCTSTRNASATRAASSAWGA